MRHSQLTGPESHFPKFPDLMLALKRGLTPFWFTYDL